MEQALADVRPKCNNSYERGDSGGSTKTITRRMSILSATEKNDPLSEDEGKPTDAVLSYRVLLRYASPPTAAEKTRAFFTTRNRDRVAR